MKPSVITLPDRPQGLRFNVQALAQPQFNTTALADHGEITILDAIGLDVTAARIAGALRSIGARPVLVQLNSPGGDYFEGVAIANLLIQHPQPVTVRILGIAASAASIIAMAGDRIEIAKNAEIMIHKAQLVALGNAEVMAAAADFLKRLDAAMARTYADRTSLPVDQVARMMAAETFMDAEQAVDLGFADIILDREADPRPAPATAQIPSTPRQLEAALRATGLSRSAAAKVAAGGFRALSPDAEEDLSAVAELLKGDITEFQRLADRLPNTY